jgi:hypothetical protein
VNKDIYINILTPFKGETFLRQLSTKFENKGFYFHENSKENRIWDLVVVYEGLTDSVKFYCKPCSLLFISGEPPMSRRYSRRFLNQFRFLITSHRKIKHPENILHHQALPWHYGLSFNTKKYTCNIHDLENMEPKNKSKDIAFITSNKKMMPGHQQRLLFLNSLRSRFGDKIDVFGQGINPIDDKASALLEYRFCISIENSSIHNYWTEKLSDAFLAYCVPIYYGCKNIEEYFDEDSIVKININEIDESLSQIDFILRNSERIYAEKKEKLIASRNLVLNNYNLFNLLEEFYLNKIISLNDTIEEIELYPSESFRDHKTKLFLLRIRRFISRFLFTQK